MDDQELERRLKQLGESWRVPGDPPLEPMWSAIEAEVFAPELPRRRWWGGWPRTLLPLAATLVLGFAIGRVAPRSARPLSPDSTGAERPLAAANGAPVIPASQDAPFVGVASDYLERVTALLATLAEEARQGQPLDYSRGQARDLLSTTRLLMEAPEAKAGHLRQLLDDLELVLAQIVRLPARPPAPDVYLIEQALDQREVLPRLRVMLAENPSSDY